MTTKARAGHSPLPTTPPVVTRTPRQPDVHLVSDELAMNYTPRERAAAIFIGGKERNYMTIRPAAGPSEGVLR